MLVISTASDVAQRCAQRICEGLKTTTRVGKDAVITVLTANVLQERMLLTDHIIWIGNDDFTLKQLLRLPIKYRRGGTYVGFHARNEDQPLTNLCVLFNDNQFSNHSDGFREYYRSVVETYPRWAECFNIPPEYEESISIKDAQWDLLAVVGLQYARRFLFRVAEMKGGVST